MLNYEIIRGIQESITGIYSTERRKYNSAKVKAFDYYRGEQMPYLAEQIQARFESSSDSKEKITANITRLIVDEMACVYSQEPLRLYKRGTEIDNLATEFFTKDRSLNSNIVLQTLDAMTHLLGSCALWVQYDAYTQTTKESVVLPQSLYIIWPRGVGYIDYSNPRNALAVIIEVGVPNHIFEESEYKKKIGKYSINHGWGDFSRQKLRRYCYISREYIIYYDATAPDEFDPDMIVADMSNPDFINPIHEIPLIWAYEDSMKMVDHTDVDSDLVNANESVNKMLSATFSNAYYQGFGIPILYKHKPPKELLLGYEFPIVCDPSLNEDFKFAAPPPMFPQLFGMLKDHLKIIALTKKIPLNVVSIEDRQGASGLALKVEASAKLEARSKRLPNFRIFERDVHILRLMWFNTYKPLGFSPMWNDLVLDVMFKDPYEPVDMNAEAEQNERMLGMGLTNPVEILMKKYNLTKDEAEARYKENLELIGQLKRVLNPVNITGVTDQASPKGAFDARGQDGKFN